MSNVIDTEELHAHIASCEKSTTKRRICHDGNAQFFRRFQYSNLVVFNVQNEGAVLNLQSRDWVDCVCTT